MDNIAEAVQRRRLPHGEGHSRSKLSEVDVLWIRDQKGVTHQAMADLFGVSKHTITMVVNGRTWTHLL